VNETELHPHPAEVRVTKGLDEARLVILASPLSEFPIEIKETGFGVVTTPDFGEFFYGLSGEEIIGVEVVGEKKGLSPEVI
jgi:hypothetical protein